MSITEERLAQIAIRCQQVGQNELLPERGWAVAEPAAEPVS